MSNQLIEINPPLDVDAIIWKAEICEATAQEVTREAMKPLIKLAKTQREQLAIIRKRIAECAYDVPCKQCIHAACGSFRDQAAIDAVDMQASAEGWQQAAKEVQL